MDLRKLKGAFAERFISNVAEELNNLAEQLGHDESLTVALVLQKGDEIQYETEFEFKLPEAFFEALAEE
ncbi:MAG: hypothetical protein Kow0065_10380 [Methylomicrobium sp.]